METCFARFLRLQRAYLISSSLRGDPVYAVKLWHKFASSSVSNQFCPGGNLRKWGRKESLKEYIYIQLEATFSTYELFGLFISANIPGDLLRILIWPPRAPQRWTHALIKSKGSALWKSANLWFKKGHLTKGSVFYIKRESLKSGEKCYSRSKEILLLWKRALIIHCFIEISTLGSAQV